MCHHQYPTRACVTGNGEVRSLWDKAPSDGQPQTVAGLGSEDMTNIGAAS